MKYFIKCIAVLAVAMAVLAGGSVQNGQDTQVPSGSKSADVGNKDVSSSLSKGAASSTLDDGAELFDEYDPAAAPIEYVDCALPKVPREVVTIPFARSPSNRTIFVFPVLVVRGMAFHNGHSIFSDRDGGEMFLSQCADGKVGQSVQVEYSIENLAITERSAVALALERHLGRTGMVARAPRFMDQEATLHILYDNMEVDSQTGVPLTCGKTSVRFVLKDQRKESFCAALRDDPFRRVDKLQLDFSIPYQVRAQVRVSSATLENTADEIASVLQELASDQSGAPELLVGVRGGSVDNEWLIQARIRSEVVLRFTRRRGMTGVYLGSGLIDRLIDPAIESVEVKSATDRIVKFVTNSGFSLTAPLGKISSISVDDYKKLLAQTEWQRKGESDRTRKLSGEITGKIPDVGELTLKPSYDGTDKLKSEELAKQSLEEISQLKQVVAGELTHLQAINLASYSKLKNDMQRFAQFMEIEDLNQLARAKYRVSFKPHPAADTTNNKTVSIPTLDAELDRSQPFLVSGAGWHSGGDWSLCATTRIEVTAPADRVKAQYVVIVRVSVTYNAQHSGDSSSTWVRECRSSPLTIGEIEDGWELDVSKIASFREEESSSANISHSAHGYALVSGRGVLRSLQIHLTSNDQGSPKGCLHFRADFNALNLPLKQIGK